MESPHAIECNTKRPATLNSLVPATWQLQDLPPYLRRFTVDELSGCWIWQGPPNGSGHGQVATPEGTTTAHRAVYETLIGPIPSAISLHHTCPNPLCVNPLHVCPALEPAHRQEHARKRWAAQRENPCPRLIGTAPGHGHLSDDDRQTIADLYFTRNATQQELAEFFGVSRQTIHNTLKRFRSASPSPAPTATHRLRTSPPVTPRPAGTPSGVAS